MMFAIERDIPPPPEPHPWAGRNSYYGFERLEPGDSFLVPTGDEGLAVSAQRVRWAIKRYQRKSDTKWRTKSTNKGVRVWRVR